MINLKNIKLSREVKISIIFLFTLFLFIWGINFLKGNDLLQNKKKYYAVYNNVAGLMTANPVMINGFKIGLVTKMEFMNDNSGNVLVEFTINKSVDITKNSIARIINADLLGSKAVMLIINKGDIAENKDTLIGETQLSFTDEIATQIDPIKTKTQKILSSLDTILDATKVVLNKQTQNNLIKSFENISQTLEHLNNTIGNVDNIVSKNKNNLSNLIENISNLSQTIKDNDKKISNIINNFSSISDTLAKANFAETINNTNKVVSELQTTLDNINKGKGTIGKLATDEALYINLKNTTENLNILIKDLKENPKRYVHMSIFGKKDKKNKEEPSQNIKE